MEEPVAELSSAFLCAELHVHPETARHASCIACWLSTIRRDGRFLLTVVRQASAVAAYLERLSHSGRH